MATEQHCIEALQEAAARLGESPTKAQYEDLDLTPSASTILRHCGGWNEAKTRAGLETNPSTGSRVEPKPDDVELPEGMTWEELSQDQRWHYRHPDENATRSVERRAALRKWLHNYKAESDGCVECNESNPACLDFHYRDSDQKVETVNKMVPKGYSRAAIRSEVQKCRLLCANCHWQEHHTQVQGIDRIAARVDPTEPLTHRSIAEVASQLSTAETPLTEEERLRAWTHAYERSQGCDRCGETDPICLQFHHDGDDKTMGVGKMIAHSYPVSKVLTEIEKCTVLCANCHRKKHYENPAVL